jgi:hypothetical protein
MPAAKSVEERLADINTKIEYHKSCIETLENKKEAVMHPVKKINAAKLIAKAKEKGLTDEQIMKKLGVEISEI